MDKNWAKMPGQSLTQNDSFVTKATGTAAVMTSIATWIVPRNTAIELNPSDSIAAYLKDAGAECLATDQWQLVIRNAVSSEYAQTVSSDIYAAIKTFDDQNKIKRVAGHYVITSDFVLDLQVKATTVLVVASCYYRITCTKYVKVVPGF